MNRDFIQSVELLKAVKDDFAKGYAPETRYELTRRVAIGEAVRAMARNCGVRLEGWPGGRRPNGELLLKSANDKPFGKRFASLLNESKAYVMDPNLRAVLPQDHQCFLLIEEVDLFVLRLYETFKEAR